MRPITGRRLKKGSDLYELAETLTRSVSNGLHAAASWRFHNHSLLHPTNLPGDSKNLVQNILGWIQSVSSDESTIVLMTESRAARFAAYVTERLGVGTAV